MSPTSEGVAEACARVKERLGSMTCESKRFALDAIGTAVWGVEHLHTVSYVRQLEDRLL